jgi:hypothetical protein
MQALNDWPPPTWPYRRPVTRYDIRSGIFKRTMRLSILGGMAMGVLCVVNYGRVALVTIIIGGFVGLPLGVIAGTVLSHIGAWLLMPYRGPVVPIVVISGVASCLVMLYLGLGLSVMADIGSSEGPQSTSGPSWDWLLMTASMAAAVLSPWVVWWHVKSVETA